MRFFVWQGGFSRFERRVPDVRKAKIMKNNAARQKISSFSACSSKMYSYTTSIWASHQPAPLCRETAYYLFSSLLLQYHILFFYPCKYTKLYTQSQIKNINIVLVFLLFI